MGFTLGIVPLTIVEDINLSIPNEVSTIEDNRGSFNILIIIANYFINIEDNRGSFNILIIIANYFISN